MPPLVALLTLHPAPYRLPVFARLGQSADFRFVTLIAHAAADQGRGTWHLPPRDAFEWRALPAFHAPKWRSNPADMEARGPLIPLTTPFALARLGPDLVIAPEFSALAAEAHAYCALTRTPRLLMSDTTCEGAGTETSARLRWRRLVARGCAGGITISESGRRYLATVGVAPESVFHAPLAADPALFYPAASGERDDIRRNLGLTKYTFLFAGRFLAFKGLSALLECWASFPPAARGEAELLLVGSGPEEARLRALGRTIPGLRFMPLQTAEHLRKLYIAADWFVLPSPNEMWGLVVNEALMCGTPALVSTGAGSVELITHGVNGLRVDPTRAHALGDALAQAFAWASRRDELGQAARAGVRAHTFEAAALGIERAAAFALSQKAPRR